MVDNRTLIEGRPAGDPRTLLGRLTQITRWDLPHMSAPHWRLYLPLDRGGELHWRGRTWPLLPGRWLLVAPGTDCAAHLLRPFRKAYGHFFWDLPGQQVEPGLYEDAVPRTIAARLQDVAAGPAVADRGLGLLIQGLFRLALATLPESAFVAAPRRSTVVAQALALLHRDPARTPGNAALAAALGLHPGSLIRRFTAEVGHPPQHEALRWRLERAAALLIEGDEGIEGIAERCGFGDRHHFSRAFRQHWRQPPAAFRRLARGG